MITHSSGSVKVASDLANEPVIDNLEQVGSDLSMSNANFTGGEALSNNPNDAKNNPIQRSSQTLHKVSQSAQRQKVVQAVQRRYGNSITARLVANYTGTTKATNPKAQPVAHVLTRVHLATTPGIISRVNSSEVGVLSAVYGIELAMAANLKAELEAAKVEANPTVKAAATQRIEGQLGTIQDIKLLLQQKNVPAANINSLIGKLDGGNPQDITAIMDFVGLHGLLNAANNLTFNNLHAPAQPITTVSTTAGAYTALANELKARPNGEAPSGTPAANPPVKDFGDTLLKIKTEALEALQKRMVRSVLRQLPHKDWINRLGGLDNTTKDGAGKTELDKALERLGLENGMPGMIQLQARAEILLKSMIDVEKPDAKQLINLSSYFTINDIDLALTKEIEDKLGNIDPASHAGKDLIKKIKQDFYKNHLVGVTGDAVAFKKLLRNLGLTSSSFNSKYHADKLRLRDEVIGIFNKALDSKQANPLTPQDIEFLQLSDTSKGELSALKDSVHSNLQKLSVALYPLLAQPGSKAKAEGYVRIPIPDGSVPGGMGFVGMRITLSGEHDVYFFENKPADDFDKTREENARIKQDLRNEMSEQLGPAGRIVSKVGDGLGKKPESTYKVRAEIALTGGYQALDLTSKFKKLFDGGAEGGFYVEGESNVNIERSLELISFGIQRRLLEHKGIPVAWIADMVWGKAEPPTTPPPANRKPLDKAKDWFDSKQKNGREWNEDFMKTLTNDEYVESGGFGNAFGSFSPLKFKGNVKQTFAKRYHKNTMQAIKDTKGITDLAPTGRQQNLGRKIRTTEVGVEFGASSFAFGGKFKMAAMPGQITPAQLDAVNAKIPLVKTDLNTAKTAMDTAKTAYEANTADAALKLDFDNKTKAYNDKKKEYDNLLLQQKLLPAHLFDVGGEVSAASKAGEWANGDPAALAASIINAVGNFAAQFKGFVTHNKSQYAKDRGNDHLYSSALTSLPTVIDEAVINNVTSTSNNWAVNAAGGLKISFKIGSKQDFALAANSGLWYEPKIGAGQFKFDISVEQIGQLGGDAVLGGGSIEKSSLLFRLSFRYRQGNWLLVEDSVMNKVVPALTRPRATAKNQLPAPAPVAAPGTTNSGTTNTLTPPNPIPTLTLPNSGPATSSNTLGTVSNPNPVSTPSVAAVANSGSSGGTTIAQPIVPPIVTATNPVTTQNNATVPAAVDPSAIPLPPSPTDGGETTAVVNSNTNTGTTSSATLPQPIVAPVVTAPNTTVPTNSSANSSTTTDANSQQPIAPLTVATNSGSSSNSTIPQPTVVPPIVTATQNNATVPTAVDPVTIPLPPSPTDADGTTAVVNSNTSSSTTSSATLPQPLTVATNSGSSSNGTIQRPTVVQPIITATNPVTTQNNSTIPASVNPRILVTPPSPTDASGTTTTVNQQQLTVPTNPVASNSQQPANPAEEAEDYGQSLRNLFGDTVRSS